MKDEAEEAEEIEDKIEEVQEKLMEIGKAMGGGQAGPGAGMGGAGFDPSNMSQEDLKKAAQNMNMGGAGQQGQSSEEDVVDADYEEVDDEE